MPAGAEADFFNTILPIPDVPVIDRGGYPIRRCLLQLRLLQPLRVLKCFELN